MNRNNVGLEKCRITEVSDYGGFTVLVTFKQCSLITKFREFKNVTRTLIKLLVIVVYFFRIMLALLSMTERVRETSVGTKG